MKQLKHLTIMIMGIFFSNWIFGQESIVKPKKKMQFAAAIHNTIGEDNGVRIGIGAFLNKSISPKLNAGIGINWKSLSTNEYVRETSVSDVYIGGYQTFVTRHTLNTVSVVQVEPRIEILPLKKLKAIFSYNLSRIVGSESFVTYAGQNSFPFLGLGLSEASYPTSNESEETTNDLAGVRMWQHYLGLGVEYELHTRIGVSTSYHFGLRDMVSPVITGQLINRFNYLNIGINYKIIK